MNYVDDFIVQRVDRVGRSWQAVAPLFIRLPDMRIAAAAFPGLPREIEQVVLAVDLFTKALLTIPEKTYSEPDMGKEHFWKQFQIHEESDLKALLQVIQNVERMQGLALGHSVSLKHTLSNLLGDEMFEKE